MTYTIQTIRRHFLEAAPWVDPEKTVDQLLVGSIERQVKRIGVGWSCCAPNLLAAAHDDCDLFITHEGLLHGPAWAPGTDSADTPWGRRRLDILRQSGMACLRLHDCWDNFPLHGIRDSWRRFLGLDDLLAERPYHYPGTGRFAARNSLALCRVHPPQTLRQFAAHLSERCGRYACFAGALVSGDPGARIERVATGVGCHITTLEMLDLGADLLVLTLDRALQETIRLPLSEMSANWIAVEHGVSEMPGMDSLSTYLRQVFSGIETIYYDREPPTWFIPPSSQSFSPA